MTNFPITDLPELTRITCEACGGDGYAVFFSHDAGDGLPAEHNAMCAACGGSGEQEVCSGCLTVPEVLGGLEVCGCVSATLKRAA